MSQKISIKVIINHCFSSGDYEYQYVKECCDISSNKKVSNKKLANVKSRSETGPKKVITVHKEDFDVFQALDMDSFAVLNSRRRYLSETNDDYGQQMPNYTKKTYLSTTPPIIPPHLLHFMLNKKPVRKVSSEHPELLPKPCHTLLNHLYAMSMKEGVMTLSSTQRYRKKYVTTIFYRPISKPSWYLLCNLFSIVMK